jgi:ribosome-associated protein
VHDVSRRLDSRQTAIEIAELLEEHQAEETLALFIGNQSDWTDYFVIATVTSTGRLRGLLRHLRQFLSDRGLTPRHRQKRVEPDGWVLIDCGNIVIHLMSKEMREFYELERLWFSGEEVFHSSKSS